MLGSGQSAAEIYRDLLQDVRHHRYSLTWVTRASRFFQMENAKLALELISHDYAEHSYNLPDAAKELRAVLRVHVTEPVGGQGQCVHFNATVALRGVP